MVGAGMAAFALLGRFFLFVLTSAIFVSELRLTPRARFLVHLSKILLFHRRS